MQSDRMDKLRNGLLVSAPKTGIPVPTKLKFEEIDDTSPKGRMLALKPGEMLEFRVPEGLDVKAVAALLNSASAGIALYRKGGDKENWRFTIRRMDHHTYGVWCEDRPPIVKRKKGKGNVGEPSTGSGDVV